MNSSSIACQAVGSKTSGAVSSAKSRSTRYRGPLAADVHRLDAGDAVDDNILPGHRIRAFGHQVFDAVDGQFTEEAVAAADRMRSGRLGLDDDDVHPVEQRANGDMDPLLGARRARVVDRHLRTMVVREVERVAGGQDLPERDGRDALVEFAVAAVAARARVDDDRARL